MRVLYLANAAQIGGANRALLTLWRAVGAHNVTPAAVCPADGPMVEACRAAGIPCKVLGYAQPSWRTPWSTLRAVRRWSRALTASHATLVHANDFHNARSVILAARRYGLPVVCHVRFHQDEAYLRWVFRGLPKPAAFIYNSEATRALVGPALTRACPRAHQVVIHNGVLLDRFAPPNARPETGRLRIGIIGNLIPIKGHLEFLLMARQLSDEGVDAEYWIVGGDIHDTGYRLALEQRTEELRLTNRVIFFGHRGDVPDLLRELDILVCASHVEPFGINVIEGMACALPVVGTRVGGIREIIEDGVTGYLVPAGDAVQLARAVGELARDRRRRLQMGRAGRQRVEHHFSADRYAEAVVEVYRRVVPGRFGRS